MKIHVPRVPRRPTRHEHVLAELGFPAPAAARLDDDARELAEHYDGLVGEMAALARRGWVHEYDCEQDLDADVYAHIIAQAVQPTGVRRVELDLSEGLLTIGAGDDRREMAIDHADHDDGDDWLDLELILACIDAVCDSLGWVVVVNADDLHAVAIGVVPERVWSRFERDRLTGVLTRWRPGDHDDEPDQDDDQDDGELDEDDDLDRDQDGGANGSLDGAHSDDGGAPGAEPAGAEPAGADPLDDELAALEELDDDDLLFDDDDEDEDSGGPGGPAPGGDDPLRWN